MKRERKETRGREGRVDVGDVSLEECGIELCKCWCEQSA